MLTNTIVTLVVFVFLEEDCIYIEITSTDGVNRLEHNPRLNEDL